MIDISPYKFWRLSDLRLLCVPLTDKYTHQLSRAQISSSPCLSSDHSGAAFRWALSCWWHQQRILAIPKTRKGPKGTISCCANEVSFGNRHQVKQPSVIPINPWLWAAGTTQGLHLSGGPFDTPAKLPGKGQQGRQQAPVMPGCLHLPWSSGMCSGWGLLSFEVAIGVNHLWFLPCWTAPGDSGEWWHVEMAQWEGGCSTHWHMNARGRGAWEGMPRPQPHQELLWCTEDMMLWEYFWTSKIFSTWAETSVCFECNQIFGKETSK